MAIVERFYGVKTIEIVNDDIVFLVTFSATFAISSKIINCKVANVLKMAANIKESDGKIISVEIIGRDRDLFELFSNSGMGVFKLPALIKVEPFEYKIEPKRINRPK